MRNMLQRFQFQKYSDFISFIFAKKMFVLSQNLSFSLLACLSAPKSVSVFLIILEKNLVDYAYGYDTTLNCWYCKLKWKISVFLGKTG